MNASAAVKGKRTATPAGEDEIDKISEQIREAAELEGVAPMPEDLIPLREEAKALADEIDRLTERRDEIKETFGKRLDEAGLQGYVLHGKVHARVTHGTRHSVDSKKLKEQMPHIWSRFLKTTSYRSVRVN